MMGIKTAVFEKLSVPKTQVVIAIARENRTQLEYVVQTTLENAFVERARNGTKYTLPNKSVLFIQVSGSMDIDVDLTKMKPKGLAKWLVDGEVA